MWIKKRNNGNTKGNGCLNQVIKRNDGNTMRNTEPRKEVIMTREIKFRAKKLPKDTDIRESELKSADMRNLEWVYGAVAIKGNVGFIFNIIDVGENLIQATQTSILVGTEGQYTGLKDVNESEYFHGDIGEFDNGDRFVIKCEWFLQFYGDWIGEPECEDQLRDFYRIERAKIIGNIYENPELLEEKND